MGVKTWQCPNCTCLNVLPQVEGDSAELKCVACKFTIQLDKTGNIVHEPIAPRS